MPKIIALPDGSEAEFPDDMPDEAISAVLRRQFGPPKAAPPSDPSLYAKYQGQAAGITDAEFERLRDEGELRGTAEAGEAILKNAPYFLAGGVTGNPIAVGVASGVGSQLISDTVRAGLGGEDAPADFGEAAKRAAIQGTIGGIIPGAGMAAEKVLRGGATRLMQSALKPTQAVLEEYRTTPTKLVKTLLDEGVNVTQGGLTKLQGLLQATNQEIREAVRNAPGMIPKERVAAQVASTASRAAKQVNPKSDLKAVGKVVEDFMDHPVYKGDLTVAEAQALKQGTYRQIGAKYGEQAAASTEAQKALARGLKEEIAAEVPTIQALNARDSQLMAATDAVGRRVAQAGNRDPVGFAWVTQAPVTFLAALMDRSPVVKSMLAHGMYKSASQATKVPESAIRAAVAAIASRADNQETQ